MDEKRISYLVEKHPALREKDLTAVNDLYDAYIFRRRKTREIWTSCCRKHAVLEKGHPILDAPHVREPRPVRWGCCVGAWSAPVEDKNPEPTKCPLCGKIAKVKELGRSGNRKNLWSYRRVVVLRRERGVLWALAFDTQKGYMDDDRKLTALPYIHLVGVYRFDGKKAEYAGRHWWGDCAWSWYNKIWQKKLARTWNFSEPFGWCNEYGLGYSVINAEETKGTPYEYCGFAEFEPHHERCMKFLALCTVYPRQVEMLMKAGFSDVVSDRIEGKLNARLLDWNEPNPLKSFGVPKEELKLFLRGNVDKEILVAYKGFRKAKMPVTLEQAQQLWSDYAGGVWFERLTTRMKRYGVGYEKITNYLEREGQRDKKNTRLGTGALVRAWCDYVDAADKLGLDMKNPVYLLPRDLWKNHDEKTKAAAALVAREAGKSRVKSLTKRYTFWSERWLIRPPINSAEIVAEGEKLKHCVGGYADRHARGVTTILFLRDKQRPGRPLVTVEMHGNMIAQIHGYKNEWAPCRANPKKIDPRILYKDFLDDWLAWLESGSKRDKNGVPVVPERAREKVAV